VTSSFDKVISKPEPHALASGGATSGPVRERPEASAFGLRGAVVEVLKCALVFLTPIASAAAAAPDELPARADEPYELVVCLDFAETPFLTPLFTDSTARQVEDQLTNFFGPLATVKVVTEDHWLLDRNLVSGVRDPALNSEMLIRQKENAKVFFVHVDFRDRLYHVTWRQLDGQMQFVGPLRCRRTPDRQWVAKAVCTAVRDDFSPVAVVRPWVGAQQSASLEFQGQRWVKQLSQVLGEDCVMQPHWVVRQRGGGVVHTPVPNTLLTVHSDGQTRQIEVVSNRSQPWQRTARIAGFRAIKLNTREGRLRLHLVDAHTGAPAINCAIRVNHESFDRNDTDRDFGEIDREGYALSRDTLKHIAFVKIALGGGAMMKLPIPITQDVSTVVCKVPVDKAAGEKDKWLRRVRMLVEDVQTMHAMLDVRFREINRLRSEKRYEPALANARMALDAVRPFRETAEENLADLKQQVDQLAIRSGEALDWATEQAARIRERETTLSQVIEGLDGAISRRNERNQYIACLQSARDAERVCDFESAIALYEEALGIQADHPETRQHVDRLKYSWRIKSPEHEAAREFVYREWSPADLTELAAKFPEAETAFGVLRSFGDQLTVRKLMKATLDHIIELGTLIDRVGGYATDSDRAEIEKYAALTEQLRAFHERLAQYAREAQKAPPDPRPPADTPPAAGVPPVAGAPATEPAAAKTPPVAAPPATRPVDRKPPAAIPPGKNVFGDDDEEEPPLE